MNKKMGFSAGRTPTSNLQAHANTVDFQNELVQQLHQLILRINGLEKELEAHKKENEIRFAQTEKKIPLTPGVSDRTYAKNIKMGLSEESAVDINTVFISGTDKKLKFKNDTGVITIL